MKFKLAALLITLFMILLSACDVEDRMDVISAASPPAGEATLTIPAQEVGETPSPIAPHSLSAQPYSSPSGAFEIFFPQNWNCSESGLLRVDCQAPEGGAAVSIRVISTGYELDQPAFTELAEAEIIFAYAGKKAYSELERLPGSGSLVILAEWREGDAFWQSEDQFTRSGAAVYHLSFNAPREVWGNYEELFREVSGKARFKPEAISDAAIYSLTFKNTAPDNLFTFEAPTSWKNTVDTAMIKKGQINWLLSPDRHAAVQTVVYRHGALIEQEFKGTKTLEILRTLYGSDFRISHYKALPDGRERLTWFVKSKSLGGISFFDSWGGSLYIFTVLWDDEFQVLYQPVLDKVVESFSHE